MMQCPMCHAKRPDLRLERAGNVVHGMEHIRAQVRVSIGYRLSCTRCRYWSILGYIEEGNFIEVSEGALCAKS